MMQPLGHIAQLHEFAEIVHRGIAAPTSDIAYKRGAINRRADQSFATDYHVTVRVAGVLGIAGRRGFAQFACQSARDADPFAFDLGPGFAPAFKCGRVVDKVHANLGQHGFGVGFDDFQRFFVQDLKIRDVAFDVLGRFDPNSCPLGPTGRTATTTCSALCCCFGHVSVSRIRPPACGL